LAEGPCVEVRGKGEVDVPEPSLQIVGVAVSKAHYVDEIKIGCAPVFNKSNKRRGKNCCLIFFLATNFTELNIIYFYTGT
jgi:hypothetical protein